MSIYGLDIGQKNQGRKQSFEIQSRKTSSEYRQSALGCRGRLEPPSRKFHDRRSRCTAAYVEPGAPTCITGSTIDWFMGSAGLANAAESKVEADTPIVKHNPVRFKL
eukprot:8529481-Heterocapsa_arctica.AAC.1